MMHWLACHAPMAYLLPNGLILGTGCIWMGPVVKAPQRVLILSGREPYAAGAGTGFCLDAISKISPRALNARFAGAAPGRRVATR